MDVMGLIIGGGAALGMLAAVIGPPGWRWQLVRLLPLLLVPVAFRVLDTHSWIFGGGGPLIVAALLVCFGAIGYLPALLATALLRALVRRMGVDAGP